MSNRMKPPYLVHRLSDGGKVVVNADGLLVSPEEIVTALNATAPEVRALLAAYAEAVKLAATPEIRRYTTDEMERRHIYLIVRDEEEGCEGEGTHIREWRLAMNSGERNG